MSASARTRRGAWSSALLVVLALFSARPEAGEPAAEHHRLTGTLARMGPETGRPLKIDLLRFSTEDARARILELFARQGVDAVKAELGSQPSLGYVWTTDSVGYLIKYAVRLTEQDGSERWLLATDRTLGSLGARPWQVDGLSSSAASPFTLIELRLKPEGRGEGRVSIGAAIDAEGGSQSLGIAGASGLPVTLTDVRWERRGGAGR